MAKYKNKNAKKTSKLDLISRIVSLADKEEKLSQRCKFNFHYFTKQAAGQDFSGWTHLELIDLLEKIKNFSEKSLKDWEKTPTGSNGALHILEIYTRFPDNTDFSEPSHIPVEAKWARFRIKQKVRLIGFVIPEGVKPHEESEVVFDSNTFYVVFLDRDHKFWKTEDD